MCWTVQSRLLFLSTLSLRRATGSGVGSWPRVIFLSTLSLRRATAVDRRIVTGFLISIHALLAESDRCTRCRRSADTDFYPRSPCGERPNARSGEQQRRMISIHALLAESDFTTTITICTALKFLSTLSLRRATLIRYRISARYTNFYPRSPCGERQQKCTKQWGTFAHMK